MDIIYNFEELSSIVSRFLTEYGNKKIVALHGSMGAGKTTFVRELCKQLGVKDAVSSPTYALINEYASNDGLTIFHADLYRLADAEAAFHAGLGEMISSGAICLIEWPDILENELPEDAIHLSFEIVSEETRRLKVYIHG
jgi:tRNA threonylcarbamoyladenosine biosynthesis protein TsaE